MKIPEEFKRLLPQLIHRVINMGWLLNRWRGQRAKVEDHIRKGHPVVPEEGGARLATNDEVLQLLRDLHERVSRLEGRVASMVGYVYAKKGQVSLPLSELPAAPSGPSTTVSEQTQPQRLTKAELRAQLAREGKLDPKWVAANHRV